MSNLYAERDIIEQGEHYSRHTSAMTSEGLHSKSVIAAELAHRDIQLEQAHARVAMLEEFVADAQQDAWRALDPDYVPPDVAGAMKSLLHRAATITQEVDPDDIEPSAWLLRKQAEAVDEFLSWAVDYCSGWAQDDMGRTYWHDKQIEAYAARLRQQADELELERQPNE